MKVKSAKTILFSILFLFSLQGHSLATKGYWIPRTDTLANGEIKYDLQVQQGPEKGKINQNATSMGLEIGILDWNLWHVEVGGDWVEPTQDDLSYGLLGNLKLSYQNIETDGWAISVGAMDFAARVGQNDNNLIYTLVEANIGEHWTVAMGGYSGNEARIKTSSGALVGIWQKTQNGSGDIGVEWMSGQGKFGYIVPGIRAVVRDGFEAILSYAIAGEPDTYRNLLLTRLTVYF